MIRKCCIKYLGRKNEKIVVATVLHTPLNCSEIIITAASPRVRRGISPSQLPFGCAFGCVSDSFYLSV